MAELKGNAVVAQSGGPTSAINASACGVVEEAHKHACITGIFGANNGIIGVLTEDLFDLGRESADTIAALRRTPSAAIGSCRYKLKSMDESRADYDRILDVFKAHNVRYFFYAGGNDSMDTADKVNRLAAEQGYELRVMGIPKTIDNDLAETDHCPGYGSVAKYWGTTAMEAGRDTESLYTSDTATVIETMGRNAGWIAAAAGVAHRSPEDAPHLVYVPEVAFSFEQFVADVRRVLKDLGRVFIIASEGLMDGKGEYITAQAGAFAQDSFGHRQLGGVAELLKSVVEKEAGVKCRYCKPGTIQRNAMHFASQTDIDEAYACGSMAVRHAVAGTSGQMVTLVRESDDPYRCTTGLAALEAVANGESKLPREFMNAEGNHITDAMRRYVTPLMQGEVSVTVGDDGLPVYARFRREPVAPKTGVPYELRGT